MINFAYDELNSRLLERLALKEGILDIPEVDHWAFSDQLWNRRIPNLSDRTKTILTDLSLSSSVTVSGQDGRASIDLDGIKPLGGLDGTIEPESFVSALNAAKSTLQTNAKYFETSAAFDYRFVDPDPFGAFPMTGEWQLSLHLDLYQEMLNVIYRCALEDAGLFLNIFEPHLIATFDKLVAPKMEKYRFTARYAEQSRVYFENIWSCFSSITKYEILSQGQQFFLRTGMGKGHHYREQLAHEEVIRVIQGNFREIVAVVPDPRNLSEAIDFREKKEVKRLSQVVSGWVEAVNDGETNYLARIGDDIRKAAKEVERLERVRKANQTDLAIVVRGALAQVPIISNFLGGVETLYSLYEKRARSRLCWINQSATKFELSGKLNT